MKLIDKFNHTETKLVISGYPETDKNAGNNYGIAWYTKETIEPIAKKYGERFVVLCEKNHDNKPKLVADGKILVLRIFDQNHHSLFPRILKWLKVFSNVKKIYVHSEFGSSGGVKNFILLIPFLLLIKIMKKNITYFSHNVVTQLDDIAPHLNLNKNTFYFRILNYGLKIYYRLLGVICDRIVVMDYEMKKRLLNFVREEKIIYSPFWIKTPELRMSKKTARKKLKIEKNKFTVLYFGFITWYKGADWIINEFKKRKEISLILAGGPAYSLKDKIYYKNYYMKQINTVNKTKNIKITGFVRDEEIEKYFSAADLIIFPYRGLIGSSGAFTFALKYKKPFIISNKMKGILDNIDFQGGLSQSGLKNNDIIFSLTSKSFSDILRRTKSKKHLNILSNLSQALSKSRSYENLIEGYYQEVFSVNNRSISSFGKVTSNAAYQLVTK